MCECVHVNVRDVCNTYMSVNVHAHEKDEEIHIHREMD